MRTNPDSVLDSTDIDRLFECATLPRPDDVANNFILWLGDVVGVPGEYVDFKPSEVAAEIGAAHADGVEFIVGHLESAGLVDRERPSNWYSLSMAGWQRFEDLRKGRVATRKAFMAMAFANQELTGLVNEHLKPAVKQTGFDLFRLDDVPEAGLIDNRLRVAIRTSKFIVADLTDENAGAYWEGGFAEGLSKHVFYMCEAHVFDRVKTHFDTNHSTTLKWRADQPQDIARQLKAAIRNTLPGDAKMNDDGEDIGR